MCDVFAFNTEVFFLSRNYKFSKIPQIGLYKSVWDYFILPGELEAEVGMAKNKT